jgi:hypothetical protein
MGSVIIDVETLKIPKRTITDDNLINVKSGSSAVQGFEFYEEVSTDEESIL